MPFPPAQWSSGTVEKCDSLRGRFEICGIKNQRRKPKRHLAGSADAAYIAVRSLDFLLGQVSLGYSLSNTDMCFPKYPCFDFTEEIIGKAESKNRHLKYKPEHGLR